MENDTALLLAQQIGLALAATQEEGLRDRFAAAALTGLISHYGHEGEDRAASEAYHIADAMLAARKVEARS